MQCKECQKTSLRPIPTNKLFKNFPGVNKFSGGHIYKSSLLQRIGVYPYEDMDRSEKFNETSLSDKKAFYSELNLEDNTDKDWSCSKGMRSIWNETSWWVWWFVAQCDTYLRMCLKTLDISVLKYMDFILLIFCLHQH